MEKLTRFDVEAYALLKAQEKRIEKELSNWARKFKLVLEPKEGMNGFAFRLEMSEESEVKQKVDYRATLVKLKGEAYVAELEKKAAEAPKMAGAASLLVRVNPCASKDERQWSSAIKERLLKALNNDEVSLFKIARGE